MALRSEYAILGALMKRPMHGYDIHKFLSSALGGVWYLGMSNMYGILRKLESDGYVSSTMETDGKRPPKRVFVISENGKGFFTDWILRPVSNIRDMRVEFIAKLFFLKALGLPGGEELVMRQKTVCRGMLESIGPAPTERWGFTRLLSDFRSCQIRSILSWLEQCLGFLEES